MPYKTSIILCTYNEARYIENTISELERNIPDIEIVIVDDCSSDGTIEIIKSLLAGLVKGRGCLFALGSPR